MRRTQVGVLLLLAVIALHCSYSLAFLPNEIVQGMFGESPPRIEGLVDDCCCTVESLNAQMENLHHGLERLKNTTFFKYFKANPYRDCKVWVEEYLCSLTEGGGCGVCICDEQEVPEAWRKEEKYENEPVDTTIEDKFTTWHDNEESMWTNEEADDPESVYLNLELNQEKNSGYGGYHANRVWTAIYRENCFLRNGTDADPEGQCFEERVFYRLLSGLHGSITAHICAHYTPDPTAPGGWRPNPEAYHWRLGRYPEYIKNVYFAFLFMLRATAHAAPFLRNYPYITGNAMEDKQTKEAAKQLFDTPILDTCSPTFDESQMFHPPQPHTPQGQPGTPEERKETEEVNAERMLALRQQMRKRFYNISEILDCVGCDTCKVNGKLQILALGTALKILLAENDTHRQHVIEHLQRNEIIALVNTLYRFSSAIEFIQQMTRLEQESYRSRVSLVYVGLGAGVALLLILVSFVVRYFKGGNNNKTKESKNKTQKRKQQKRKAD